jgi:hypothetical protein
MLRTPSEVAMPLVFRTLHRAGKPELLNEEWLIVENTGPGPLSSAGWTLAVAAGRGQRPRPLGTMQPGFMIKPGEKVRLVTGTPSKKAQGAPPPEEGVKNYHLFLREAVLARPGQVLSLLLKQAELARATFDPEAPDGIRSE